MGLQRKPRFNSLKRQDGISGRPFTPVTDQIDIIQQSILKAHRKRLLELGYCEGVARRANQSALNRRLKGQPVSLSKFSIQDEKDHA